MAYTSHGHQIEGTPVEGERPTVMRCGGPGLCPQCSIDSRRNTPNIPKTQTGLTMELTTFVRKPFSVEAVEVTEENIGEIAPYVGELKEKADGTPFILVDRRKVPNIYRVYPGFWMTRMGDNTRCYSERIFKEQFTPSTPDIEEWVRFLNGEANRNVFEGNDSDGV